MCCFIRPHGALALYYAQESLLALFQYYTAFKGGGVCRGVNIGHFSVVHQYAAAFYRAARVTLAGAKFAKHKKIGNPKAGGFDFGGEKREVRFYLRIGKNTQLKLQDTIYSQNLPQRTLSESGLEAITELGTGALKVSWNSYQNPDIYYRVEISKKMDLTQPYFVSRIQPATSTGMTINTTTSGEVNRIGELIKGESYRVRLTALMFEPGVDVINDEYSSANLQAVTYFSRGFLWE